MDAAPALDRTKVSKTFGLRPAYVVAVKVLAKREGHEIDSEIVRSLIDQEMKQEFGRNWESDIITVAASEGVLPSSIWTQP